ncbi:ATP-dependent metallopeptidase FtsH/Yme1/Tma family protein, partial [Deinococcus aquiradiocola]|uniref:ATP-dependent metallopeptidase FtsH/Yme1/Tma family protein n=1 Tax=Deinococcus aquiradiocola TaxID=393059 RepID=UPI00166BE7DF
MTTPPPRKPVWPWWVLGGVVALLLLIGIVAPRDNTSELALSDFQTALAQGQVSRVVITNQNNLATVSGMLRSGATFSTRTLSSDPLISLPSLEARGVAVQLASTGRLGWVTVLSTVLTGALIVVLLVVLLRGNRQGGGDAAGAFGRSKATVHSEGQVKVSFADVAGADEAKADLVEVV